MALSFRSKKMSQYKNYYKAKKKILFFQRHALKIVFGILKVNQIEGFLIKICCSAP